MRLPISDDEFWDTWLSLPVVQSFERGDICAEEFLPRLAQALDIGDEPGEFRQRFLDWHPRLYPVVESLISSLGANVFWRFSQIQISYTGIIFAMRHQFFGNLTTCFFLLRLGTVSLILVRLT